MADQDLSLGSPDERQERVLDALADRSQELAGMYRTGLAMLATPPASGKDLARVSLVCHAFRELMMVLPSVLGDSASERPDPSSAALLGKMPALIAGHPEVDLAQDLDLVPVPRRVAHALDELLRTLALEDGRNRANAAAMLTGDTDGKHPLLDEWKATYRFFVSWAHLDRNIDSGRTLPSDDQLRQRIRVVEDVIEVRAGAFFDTLHSIEELLAEINYQGGETAT